MNSKIHLSGMEFYAHHGCFQEERQVGTHFKVDLILEYDTTQAALTDDIHHTVNYQTVYLEVKEATQAALTDDIHHTVNYQTVYLEVKEIMQHPVNLLETLCQNILSMLADKFPQVIAAEVAVHKLNPALGGKVVSVSVVANHSK